ncbi:MAG TPA: YoaK family protein [Terracidiphilus sp.]|nr:YoaK family protein [Terracidiphilus sp.]
MRQSERDVLLLLLAVAAGSADGWSYFGLGHAFVANMTGNTVLLGIAVFLQGDLLHPGISLVCYAAGAALAAFLTRNVRQGGVWPRAVSYTLVLESAPLIAAAIGWALAGRTATLPGSTPALDVLLGCVALAIGIQSGAMLQLRIPGVVTTYITGTWTNLMTGLTRFFSREKRRPAGQKIEHEERMMMQGAILCAYLFSAMATGLLFRYARLAVGVLPALSVLLVALYGLAHRRQTNA